MRARFTLGFAVCLMLLGACGGSGAGGNGATGASSGPSSSASLQGALWFESPATFANESVYETARTGVRITGELRSQWVPVIDCDANPRAVARDLLEVRWRNETTGARGRTRAAARCYDTGTIFGVGVQSFWGTELIGLELGLNTIRFESFDGTRQVGVDIVRIRRTDGVPPTVTYVYPQPDAAGVPANRPIIVQFSEAMVVASLTSERLEVIDAQDNSVAGRHVYYPEHFAWVFTPATDLAAHASYQVRVARGVRDEGGGGDLQADQTWTFSVGSGIDAAAPTIRSRWPGADGCNCASPDTQVFLELDEPLDPDSVSATSLVLEDRDAVAIAGVAKYHGDFLAFVPDQPLQPGVTYRVSVGPGLLDTVGRSLVVPLAWTFATNNEQPIGSWREAAPPPLALSAAAGTATADDVWLWGAAQDGRGRAMRYDAILDSWSLPSAEYVDEDPFTGTVTRSPFPSARRNPTVVWAGSEAIVYGGDEQASNTEVGGAYDPVSDTWRKLESGWRGDNAPTFNFLQQLAGHSAVWSGSEMIVWGGYYGGAGAQLINQGWRYDAVADTWALIGPPPGETEWRLPGDPAAPRPRSGHHAVWTGAEMIVWGGVDGSGVALSDGGRYAPASDSWRMLPATSCARGGVDAASLVWTGDRALAWNGGAGTVGGADLRVVSLCAYFPRTDSWQSSRAGWEPRFLPMPQARFQGVWTGEHVWYVGVIATGSELDAASGNNRQLYTIGAYRYHPATHNWQAGAQMEVSGIHAFLAFWRGGQLNLYTGAGMLIFDP